MSMNKSFLKEDEATDGIRGSTWGSFGEYRNLEVGVFQDGTIDLQIDRGFVVNVSIEDLQEIVNTANEFLAWKNHQKVLRSLSKNP